MDLNQTEVLDRSTLYVGLDESNNIADPLNRGEIITATFSYSPEDSVERDYPKRRDYRTLTRWLGGEGKERDYRFAILTNDELRRFTPNAPLVVPALIDSYLMGQLNLGISELPENLSLSIDGILPKIQREYLKDRFSGSFETIRVKNYIKRRRVASRKRKGERVRGPRMIQMADILANSLYNGQDGEGAKIENPKTLFRHAKGVSLDESILFKLMKKEKKLRESA